MASVLPNGMDCVLACGICPNSREGLAAGRMMSRKGRGSSMGLVGVESRRWKQSIWQAGNSPACLLVRAAQEEWESFGVWDRAQHGAVAEIGGHGPQDMRVTHMRHQCLCLMWFAPQWQKATGVRSTAQKQQGQG